MLHGSSRLAYQTSHPHGMHTMVHLLILPVLIRSRTSTRKLVSSVAEDDVYFQQFAEESKKQKPAITFQTWTTLIQNGGTDVRALAAVATTTHCNSTLGVAVGAATIRRRPTLGKCKTSLEKCMSSFSCARLHRLSSPSLVKP